MSARDVIATAVEAETDNFRRPVRFYVRGEAEYRYDLEHGDCSHYDLEKHDWNRESWLIIADAVLIDLTAAGYRIVGPEESSSTVDDMAAAMWKAEAEDAGAPPSVAAGRTRAVFDEQTEDLKARWRKFARAALRSLTGGGNG